MKDKLELSLQQFTEATQRLQEGVEESCNELDKDGVIQRFEFTFELLWKTLKIYLEDKGTLVKTPKDSLKAAFKVDLLQDEELFLAMLTDRNKSSHIYSKDESERIFQRIKQDYLPAFLAVISRIQ